MQAGAQLKANSLNLDTLLNTTASFFKDGVLAADTVDAVQAFIYERYRNQLSNDYERSVVDAVLALRPPLEQVHARIQACASFAQRPEAESLAAANKRVSNLLSKFDERFVLDARAGGAADDVQPLVLESRHGAESPAGDVVENLTAENLVVENDMNAMEVSRRMEGDMADAKALAVSKTPEYFVNGRQMDEFGLDQLRNLIAGELRRAYP